MGEQAIDQLLAFGPWNLRTLLIAAGLFAFAVGTRFPRLLVITSVGCYAAMMLNPALVTVPTLVDLRLIGLSLVVYLAMIRQRLPRFPVLRGGAFPATFVYLLLGLAFVTVAQDRGKATQGLIGTLITLVYAWTLLCAADDEEIRSAISWSAGLMVIGSLVLVVVDPGSALAGGRWRGMTANANTLGIFGGLFFLTGKPRTGRWRIIPTLMVLVGSASRGSALALGLVAGPKMLEGKSRRVRQAAAVLAIVVALPILHAVFFSGSDATGSGSQSETGITRTQNSRIDEWADAIDIFQAHPITGVGVGSQPDLVSSSLISPLVEVGIGVLVPFAMIAALAIRKARTPFTWSRSVFYLLCINGLFEMWLFAGGSMFFMVFLVAAYGPGRRDPGQAPEPEAETEGDSLLADALDGGDRSP